MYTNDFFYRFYLHGGPLKVAMIFLRLWFSKWKSLNKVGNVCEVWLLCLFCTPFQKFFVIAYFVGLTLTGGFKGRSHHEGIAKISSHTVQSSLKIKGLHLIFFCGASL